MALFGEGKKMSKLSEELGEFWEECSPAWLFLARPGEYEVGATYYSLCPGLFFYNGLCGLFVLHWLCLAGFLSQLPPSGSHTGWVLPLLPLAVLWLLFVPADIKFRLQKPSQRARDGFDTAAVNWFGFLFTLFFYFVLIPAGAVMLLWNWLH